MREIQFLIFWLRQAILGFSIGKWKLRYIPRPFRGTFSNLIPLDSDGAFYPLRLGFDFQIANQTGVDVEPTSSTTTSTEVPTTTTTEPTSVYGLISFNQYQSVAHKTRSMSSFQVMRLQEPVPSAILMHDISYELTLLPSGHYLLTPSDPIHRPIRQTVEHGSGLDFTEVVGHPDQGDQLLVMKKRLKKVKKRSRQKRTVFDITNKISTVGTNGHKEGDNNLDHVSNSRIAVSRTGPASNGPSPAKVAPVATSAPAVTLPQNPPTQYIYADRGELIHRHPRHHVQTRGPRIDAGFDLETRTTYDTRGNYGSPRSTHGRTDPLLYHQLYNDLYDQLTSDIHFVLETKFSRSYVRPRSRRSVLENMNSYEDNGNVSVDDHETPLHSYITIDGPLGRYDVFHVPSEHENATNSFFLSFQNGTLHINGENVTIDQDDELYGSLSGPTTIFISQTDDKPSYRTNTTLSALNIGSEDSSDWTFNIVGFTNLIVIPILILIAITCGILYCRRRCNSTTSDSVGGVHLI